RVFCAQIESCRPERETRGLRHNRESSVSGCAFGTADAGDVAGRNHIRGLYPEPGPKLHRIQWAGFYGIGSSSAADAAASQKFDGVGFYPLYPSTTSVFSRWS